MKILIIFFYSFIITKILLHIIFIKYYTHENFYNIILTLIYVKWSIVYSVFLYSMYL